MLLKPLIEKLVRYIQEVWWIYDSFVITTTNDVLEVKDNQLSRTLSKGVFIFNTSTLNTITVTLLGTGAAFPLPPLSQVDLPLAALKYSLSSTTPGAHALVFIILRG